MDTAYIKRLYLHTTALTGLALAASTAFAQTTGADEGASDRAKRQAENPLKWIMMLDDKPRQATKPGEKKAPAAQATRGGGAEPAAATSPAPARAAAAAAPATPPAKTAAAPATPAAAPAVAAEPSAAATAAAAIAPAMAAREPEPELPEPMKLIVQVTPELNRDVMNRGIRNGRVKVKFNVLPDGSTADVEITSSTNRFLNNTVLNAVRQWKYAPIKRMQEHGAEVAFSLDQ